MRIFVTGAPGFIGSELVPELIEAGHSVPGLTRSEVGAEKLRAAGAEVLHGNIEDLDSLRKGAADSDGVIHLAFNHDFSQFEKNTADDRKAITAMGEALLGSDRPFVVTSGTAIAANVDGKPSTEDGPTAAWNPRAASEAAVKELTARGVNTTVVRLPQVHDTRKQGLVPYIAAVAREKRLSAYIGDGGKRWPAAHVSDVARLYRLAFEKAEQGAIYHAVDEEGISAPRPGPVSRVYPKYPQNKLIKTTPATVYGVSAPTNSSPFAKMTAQLPRRLPLQVGLRDAEFHPPNRENRQPGISGSAPQRLVYRSLRSILSNCWSELTIFDPCYPADQYRTSGAQFPIVETHSNPWKGDGRR